MKKTAGSIGALALIAVLSLACPPASRACSGDVSIQDASVRLALQSALESRSDFSLAKEGEAEGYKSYIERALERTFGKEMSTLSGGHTCSIYTSGENRFSVHVLAIAEGPGRDAIVKRVEQRQANTLQIEALTYYTFIPAQGALIFLVADGSSYAELKPMLEEIRARSQAR